jgi:hypothetical protein
MHPSPLLAELFAESKLRCVAYNALPDAPRQPQRARRRSRGRITRWRE